MGRFHCYEPPMYAVKKEALPEVLTVIKAIYPCKEYVDSLTEAFPPA